MRIPARLEPDGLSVCVSIARPDHWFKNVFMLPGAALAVILSTAPVGVGALSNIVIAVVATCCIASANYTINEWLDAESDRHHPIKRHRPSVAGRVTPTLALTQWAVLAVLGLGLAVLLSSQFLVYAAALLTMGLVYNVRPWRAKDRQYLDVLSEAINNPLRFMLGWAAIAPGLLPPSSILVSYWMGGAFLMAIKRYAEYRFIDDPERAGRYRRSFVAYTENSLLTSAFFYALTSAFFLGVFLIKYRIEFLLAMPFLSLLFTWYLHLGMRSGSVTQKPEKLYKETDFMLYVAFVGMLVLALFVIDIPWMQVFLDQHVIGR